jgi:hypothetical protein
MLQLVECIESIKSDVKKKMMWHESVIDAPKSPHTFANQFCRVERLVEATFMKNNSREFVIEHHSCKISIQLEWPCRISYCARYNQIDFSQREQQRIYNSREKIFAGAHEWPLSTML